MGLVRLVHAVKAKNVTHPWFVLKASLAGGIVYYTIEEGLWSKSEKSVVLYQKIYSNVAPYVKENLPKEVVHEVAKLPSTSAISNFTRTTWNNGVMMSMKFISELPGYVCKGTRNLSATVQNYLKDQNQQKE